MLTPSKPSPCVGIRTCSDYSPFGVELDGRTVSLELGILKTAKPLIKLYDKI